MLSITITPTDTVALVNDSPCRRWRGITADGGRCDVYVALIGAGEEATQRELETALLSVRVVEEGRPC